MKIAYLQRADNTLPDKIHIVLERNGFRNISISYSSGIIHAEKRIGWLIKKARVVIKITDINDNKGTHLEITVNENEAKYDKASNIYERLEEKIEDIIYNSF